eukprot:3941644-Rhodomonas_salina.17
MRWCRYIGVYAGATGAEFNLKVKLMKACPNDCFGNGKCVQKKIRACVCFPGYTGIDCRDTVKEKMFAWYPLDEDVKDITENQTPIFYKVNLNGQLNYAFGGLSLQVSSLICLTARFAISGTEIADVGIRTRT